MCTSGRAAGVKLWLGAVAVRPAPENHAGCGELETVPLQFPWLFCCGGGRFTTEELKAASVAAELALSAGTARPARDARSTEAAEGADAHGVAEAADGAEGAEGADGALGCLPITT